MKRNRHPTLGMLRSDTGEVTLIKHRAVEDAIRGRDEALKSLTQRCHAAEAECARRGLELSKLNLTRWVRLGRWLGAIPKGACDMRWPNGGPPKLYAIVESANGDVFTFDRKQKRTAWMVKHHPTFVAGDYVYLTYEQIPPKK